MELQARLTAILDYVETGVKDTADFAVEQAPLLVQEILRWHIFIGILAFIGILLLLIPMRWTFNIIKRYVKGYRNKKHDWHDEPVEMWYLLWLGWAVPILLLSLFIADAIKAWIAPRLFLIEYIADIVKTVN